VGGDGGVDGIGGRVTSVGGTEGRTSFNVVFPSSSIVTLIAFSGGITGLIDEIHHRPATSSTCRNTASAIAVGERLSGCVVCE
jgi:hypothetical protein